MTLVDQPAFFQQLAALFESTQKKGSIWLTHKRLTYTDGQSPSAAPAPSEDDENEYPVLVRATNGKAVEFETVVQPSELEKFHAQYGTLLKASMPTLRKRDKKKEKLKAEEAAKRKKKLAEPVVVDGPKRGAGRKKRSRKIKAALKQEETKKRIEEREAAKEKAKAA